MTTTITVPEVLAHITKTADNPAFSFFFRIHSGSEKQIHDSGHIRNRCHEVMKEQDLDTALFETLKEKIDRLIENIDYQSGAKSIGLFVSSNHSHSMTYYVSLPELHYVGNYFSGYESAYAWQESSPYVLFLFEPATVHAYQGQGAHLERMAVSRQLEELHSVYKKRTPKSADKDGKHNKVTEHDAGWKDELLAAVSAICKSEAAPAYIVGLAPAGISESEIKESGVSLLAAKDEACQKASADKLKSLVEELIDKHRKQMSQRLVEECKEALGNKKLASGLDDILACANEGRGATLILEDPSWSTDAVAKFSTVHEALRVVMEKHGKVIFVPKGALKQWNGAAMILRY